MSNLLTQRPQRIKSLHSLMLSMTDDEWNNLAKSLKTTGKYLQQIAYGNKRAGVALALRIAGSRKCKVSKAALRPDIFKPAKASNE